MNMRIDVVCDIFKILFGGAKKESPKPIRIKKKPTPQLKLVIDRIWYTNKSTVGKLYVDEIFECYVLEDYDRLSKGRKKVYGETAIPRGVYEVRLSYSPKFKRRLPLLVSVPGFTGIRIHAGNTAKDTEGCLLPGLTRSTNFVGQSKRAFNKLFPKLEAAKQNGKRITITIN